MSAANPFAKCPVCMAQTLDDHCKSPKCTWHKCRMSDCEAIIDLVNGRGFKPDPKSPSSARTFLPVTLGGQ
jgi:hypothetical protein